MSIREFKNLFVRFLGKSFANFTQYNEAQRWNSLFGEAKNFRFPGRNPGFEKSFFQVVIISIFPRNFSKKEREREKKRDRERNREMEFVEHSISTKIE